MNLEEKIKENDIILSEAESEVGTKNIERMKERALILLEINHFFWDRLKENQNWHMRKILTITARTSVWLHFLQNILPGVSYSQPVRTVFSRAAQKFQGRSQSEIRHARFSAWIQMS